MIQNFSAYKDVTMLAAGDLPAAEDGCRRQSGQGRRRQPGHGERHHRRPRRLPMGPIASQEAIKELGTNGGGFLNANSAHPYENPTRLSNFLEMLAIILIPAALTYTFGRMVGDTRQGWAVLGAMAHPVRVARTRSVITTSRSAIRASPPSASTRRRACCSRAATWRARRRASASPTPRSSPPSPPAPPAAR